MYSKYAYANSTGGHARNKSMDHISNSTRPQQSPCGKIL